mgnify:FL=1
MNILLTGGTGFIGSALVSSLLEDAHQVTVLSRQPIAGGDGLNYITALDALGEDARIDAVINLAGASLADKRWTEIYKQEILSSRLDTTQQVVELIGRLKQPPAVLLSASAIGYYGHHDDEILGEDGESTPGFAQNLCAEWERAAMRAGSGSTRVCLLRLGVVLDNGGGAFKQMELPFRLGVANWMGHGRQWLSWIHREDVIAAIKLLLEAPGLSGPFNLTAPEPVTSRGFCDAMKRHHRTFVTAPVPAFVMRLMVGEMAGELLLNGQRVVPTALQAAGFNFRYPTLDSALSAISAG